MLLRDLSYEDRKLGYSLSSCFEREESEEWRDKVKRNTEDQAYVVSLIPKTNTYIISSSFIPEISKSKITYKPLQGQTFYENNLHNQSVASSKFYTSTPRPSGELLFHRWQNVLKGLLFFTTSCRIIRREGWKIDIMEISQYCSRKFSFKFRLKVKLDSQ